MKIWNILWQGVTNLTSRSFICGYCGNPMATNMGYVAQPQNPSLSAQQGFIYICHYCKSPTFFDPNQKQTPGAIFGKVVNEISHLKRWKNCTMKQGDASV